MRFQNAAPRALITSSIALAALLPSAASALTHGFETTWGHPKPQGNPIYDYSFLSDSHGFAAGWRGTVLATTDAGVSWEIRSDIDSFGKDLYGIHAFNASHLLAVGEAPGVFRSTDGGATWSEVPNPSTGELHHLWVDSSGCFDAAGENGDVIRSTDAGATWSEIGPPTGTIESQYWSSPSHGWVVGANVAHRTTNGGSTWTQFVDFDPFGFSEVNFATATHGWVIADFAVWWTTNGGATWVEEPTFTSPLYRRKTLVLTPEHWLLIVDTEGAELWETFDAGASWELRQQQSTQAYLDIAQTPNGRVHIASDMGDLLRSDDLGTTVVNATLRLDDGEFGPIADVAATPSSILHAANSPSIGGWNAVFLRSTDLGASWTRENGPPVPRPQALVWPTDRIGLVGSYEEIHRTTDAGETWSEWTLPNGERVVDMDVADGTLYMASYHQDSPGGALYRSLDEGSTWSDVSASLPGDFDCSALHFPDGAPGTGYLAGWVSPFSPAPRLYRTTNDGASWSPVPLPTSDGIVRNMHWFDSATGLITYGWNGVYRTTNGGANWSPVSTEAIWQFDFLGPIGFSSGGSFFDPGFVTTDGGASWTESAVPISAWPSHVEATPLGFVIGGHGTTLLRLVDPAISGLEVGSGDHEGSGGSRIGALAGAIQLSLAGANPASGPTELRLHLERPADVRVFVLDVNGRRVATLSDGFRSAGAFPITWDGGDAAGRVVPAGMYFVCAEGDGTRVAVRVLRVE